jgi:hypothetical protein
MQYFLMHSRFRRSSIVFFFMFISPLQAHRAICPYGIHKRNAILPKPSTIRRYVNSVVIDNSVYFSSLLSVRRHSNHKDIHRDSKGNAKKKSN